MPWIVAAGCGQRSGSAISSGGNAESTAIETELERRQRMVGELQDDVLGSYERDEAPDITTALIDAEVGPARIGVGPGDMLFGDDVKLRGSSRWPLFVEPGTPTEVRSKRLNIHLSSDRLVTAAWISDEVSWRVTLCGRTAAVPFRITALYARDGDRWVRVVEHLSFGSVPIPTPELYGLAVGSAIADRALAETLARTLAPVLSHDTSRLRSTVWFAKPSSESVMQPSPTLLIAPDPEGEWQGTDDIGRAQLVDGMLEPEGRRIGTIGPSVGRSTVAYWVGNFVATLAPRPGFDGGKVRLRGSFVFEKRAENQSAPTDCNNSKNACKWYVVQGHISRPIDDTSLASIVFGTALLSEKPLQIMCDSADTKAPPAEAPAPAVPPPVAPPPAAAPATSAAPAPAAAPAKPAASAPVAAPATPAAPKPATAPTPPAGPAVPPRRSP